MATNNDTNDDRFDRGEGAIDFWIDFYFDYQGDFPGFDTWKIALVMIVFVDVHRSVTILNTICQTSETIKIYI